MMTTTSDDGVAAFDGDDELVVTTKHLFSQLNPLPLPPFQQPLMKTKCQCEKN